MRPWLYLLTAVTLMGAGLVMSRSRDIMEENTRVILPKSARVRSRLVDEKLGEQVAALPVRETSTTALSGSNPGPLPAAKEPAGKGGSITRRLLERPRRKAADVPLFFELDPDEMARRVPQIPQEAMATFREEFIEEAGIGVLDPEDPVYAERWARAELTLEQRIRLFYGWQAWGAYQHQLAVKAYQERRTSGNP